MRLMRTGLMVLLLALCGFAPAAAIRASLDPVIAQLARPALLRGHFEQRKQVAGFRKPLLSRGEFALVRDRGVLWHTQVPFVSDLAVTPERISMDSAGSRRQIDTAQEPSLRVINQLLFDLLAGDIARLQVAFELQSVAWNQQRWTLRLKPKSGPMAAAFVAVQLEGEVHVERVVLSERNGDSTDISFSELRESPPLNSDEAARLDD